MSLRSAVAVTDDGLHDPIHTIHRPSMLQAPSGLPPPEGLRPPTHAWASMWDARVDRRLHPRLEGLRDIALFTRALHCRRLPAQQRLAARCRTTGAAFGLRGRG